MKNASNSYDKDSLLFVINNQRIVIKTNCFFTIEEPENINEMTNQNLSMLQSRLENCVCKDKEEELSEIISKLNEDITNIKKNENDFTNLQFIKLIPTTLKKLAHKKNKLIFYKWLATVRELKTKYPNSYLLIEEKIEQLVALAEIRFST